jgi:signal transduction histidine kinase
MPDTIGLAAISELGTRALASSADAIAAVCELVQRTTGIDITVVSEVTAGGQYVFRGLEQTAGVPVERGAAIPYDLSLCSRIHAGESPATVPDTREVPALWRQWLRLKEGLGVDWDILAFCTRDIRLPDGELYGTLCIHHLEPRAFSADEQALLEVLARLLGEELWRERAARELAASVAALDAADERRVELVEELRHELRAPLQVIDGYAEAMLDDVVAADEEHLTLVQREAGRAMQLLDDLTELARLEVRVAKQPSGEPAEVAADETAVEMRDRLAPLAESAGVELVADVERATLPLPRKRLEQFFVNLVRNALRAVQNGGGKRVTIFVRVEDGVAAVGVEDDGPGLDPDELPRIFERFFRGSSARESGSGSGLGLTIARRIVEAAGGEIAAEPGPGGGARIVARLPLVADAQRAPRGDEAGVQA